MSSMVYAATRVALLLALLWFETSSSYCRQSYVTICDTMADLIGRDDVTTWTELFVGGEDTLGNPSSSLDFYNLKNFRRLISLTVVGQLNRIKTLFGRCEYEHNLQTITFYNNDIKTLETHSIPGFNLKKASFMNNNIEVVEVAPFDGQVEILDLSNNKIEAIEEYRFVSHVRKDAMKILTIKNNRISYIQPKSLPSSLKVLNLDGNNLRSIEKDSLDNLQELEEITLSHNHLYTIPDISSATKLKLIDMSYNKISSINSNSFRNLTKLYFLDLSNNRIRTAKLLDFSSLFNNQRKLVSVGFNRLLEFNMENVTEIGAKGPGNIELFLYGNPFSCAGFNKMQEATNRLKIRQNACDMKFQSEGKTPVCLNYDDIFYKDLDKIVQDFYTSIEKNKGLISCNLLPANFIYDETLACVA